ncbi:MAG: DUF1800 family protein [Deltaproteobacteria bacterium]|nr:DUF1800 family protein [Deltaproteobacteria bacterium]
MGPGKLYTNDDDRWHKLQRWWIDRMVKGLSPVREKIVLFLHTHFATARSKVTDTLYMATQNALFREFANGDFRELVKRVNVDPATLWWLDGRTNKKGAPNENYGRELMELFTLGVFDFAGKRNYSQSDVKQVARVLTGWRVHEANGHISPEFRFTDRHDKNAKTVFAADPTETPNQNAANVFNEPANTTDEGLATDEHRRLVDAIFSHIDTEGRPTAARHIARKVWKFFAYDPVVDAGTARTDLSLIDDLADVFVANGYSLTELLRAVFLRQEFYFDPTRTVKSPVEYVTGTLRMLRARLAGDTKLVLGDDGTTTFPGMSTMSQELFNPPDVFSWKGNEAWITTQALLKRFEFGRSLSERDKGRKDPFNSHLANDIGFNVYSYLDLAETRRAAVVDRFLKLLGPLNVDTATHNELVAWLGPADPIDLTDTTFVQKRVRGLLNLIFTLPHYHVH